MKRVAERKTKLLPQSQREILMYKHHNHKSTQVHTYIHTNTPTNTHTNKPKGEMLANINMLVTLRLLLNYASESLFLGKNALITVLCAKQ